MSNSNSSHPDSHRSIIKSTSVISLGTLSSRILGFVRDIILAKIFGTGFRADAFFVAQKIPNLFRDFVGEGATNSAVVPVFADYLVKKDRKDFWQFVSVVLVLALIVLTTLTVMGIWLAPYIVRLIAPGFMAHSDKLELTINLTKIMFPYLILIGLTAYSMAILYTFRMFVTPAFSPCLLNIAMIIGAPLSVRYLKEPVYGLAAAVLIGGVLQLLVQIPPMLKSGMKLQKGPMNHPGALRVGKLLVPRVFGAGVYQLNVFVDTFCASLSSVVGAGGISALYYANRIIQFPMGIFGFAIASAVLPTLSGLASRSEMGQMKKTLVFALENIIFVMFPMSVMIMLFAQPVIQLLFERGEFDHYSTMITTQALFFSALGLCSFGGIKILVTAFHALQDTRTPVVVAAVCLAINAALNFLLMYPLKVGGIALASSISATVDFVWLFYLLDKKLGGLNGGFHRFLVRTVGAAVASGVISFGIWRWTFVANDILRLSLACLVSILLYGTMCFWLNVMQARKIFVWLKEFRAAGNS